MTPYLTTNQPTIRCERTLVPFKHEVPPFPERATRTSPGSFPRRGTHVTKEISGPLLYGDRVALLGVCEIVARRAAGRAKAAQLIKIAPRHTR